MAEKPSRAQVPGYKDPKPVTRHHDSSSHNSCAPAHTLEALAQHRVCTGGTPWRSCTKKQALGLEVYFGFKM